MSVPNLKRISLFVQKLLGSQNFKFWSRDLDHAQLGGRFMVHRQGGSVLHLRTKSEAYILIHSKVMRGSKNWKLGNVTLATPT